jgi:hypothetical protein
MIPEPQRPRVVSARAYPADARDDRGRTFPFYMRIEATNEAFERIERFWRDPITCLTDRAKR